jgi:hypothetical protein
MCGSVEMKLDYLSAKVVDNATPANAVGNEDDNRQVGDAIKEANQAVENMSGPKTILEAAGDINEGVSKGVEVIVAINQLWGPLLDNVSGFMKIVDQLTDVSNFPNSIDMRFCYHAIADPPICEDGMDRAFSATQGSNP